MDDLRCPAAKVTTAPRYQCFDSIFEGSDPRCVISGHADTEQRDSIRVDFGAANQIVDASFAGHFVVGPGFDSL